MSMKRRKRRLWDDDEKHRIVAQTRVPGVSVSQVARCYDVNANLVFKWLRDPRPLDSKISIIASDTLGSMTGGSMSGGAGAATTSTGKNDAAGSSTAVGVKRGSRSHLNTRFAFTS